MVLLIKKIGRGREGRREEKGGWEGGRKAGRRGGNGVGEGGRRVGAGNGAWGRGVRVGGGNMGLGRVDKTTIRLSLKQCSVDLYKLKRKVTVSR